MPKAKHAAAPAPPPEGDGRKLWYYVRGVGPREPHEIRGAAADKADYWCREGDAEWTPIVREGTNQGDPP